MDPNMNPTSFISIFGVLGGITMMVLTLDGIVQKKALRNPVERLNAELFYIAAVVMVGSAVLFALTYGAGA
jgi:hypothetical protein